MLTTQEIKRIKKKWQRGNIQESKRKKRKRKKEEATWPEKYKKNENWMKPMCK